MTDRTLMDAVIVLLRSATSDNLADTSTRVYRGDQGANARDQGVFVFPVGARWSPHAIGMVDASERTIAVVLQVSEADPNGSSTNQEQFSTFMDLSEEITTRLLSISSRRITDEDSNVSYKVSECSWQYGYVDPADVGNKKVRACRWDVTWRTPQS